MIYCNLFNKGWWPLTLPVLVVLSSVCLINMMLVSCHVLLKGWILDIIGYLSVFIPTMFVVTNLMAPGDDCYRLKLQGAPQQTPRAPTRCIHYSCGVRLINWCIVRPFLCQVRFREVSVISFIRNLANKLCVALLIAYWCLDWLIFTLPSPRQVIYGLTVWWKRPENLEQPVKHTGARMACWNYLSTCEIGKGPTGLHRKMVKIWYWWSSFEFNNACYIWIGKIL